MAVGRISGPLLKANLLRDGIDLAFETDLLYLDVKNGRVGIKTTTPSNDLTINGTTRSTNIQATSQSTIATFNFATNVISSTDSTIVFSPSSPNPVVYQSLLKVNDNLQISTNAIQTTVTNSDLTMGTSGTGTVIVNAPVLVNGNLYTTGNLDVSGDVHIGGNITIGDQSSDTVTFVAGINSDIVPSVTATYDLGTPTYRWNNVYVSRAEVDTLVIDSNTISTTNANDDLQLIANGTGRIYIPSNNVQIDQSLTVTNDLTVTTGTSSLKSVNITGNIGQTGNINQTGNFTTSGTATVTGNITATGYLQLPQITITGNSIYTTPTNTDLELYANGTGNVIIEGLKVQDNTIQSIATDTNITLTTQGTGGVVINSTRSITIPVGTTVQRPLTPANGMIRYNTTLSRYEGYNNGYWLQLSGVIDNSGNTRILAEATPGANDNTLYFYANNNLTATIDSTKLFAQKIQTSSLDINGNTISTIATNTDINLTTTGTGRVRFGNLAVNTNTITNVASNAITEFLQTGTGYVKFTGVNGVVIPSGDTLHDRPTVTETGMIRFNTQSVMVEIFDGVSWISIAGNSGGISASTAEDMGLASALIFG
jgi:hypothetical protein